MEGHRTEEFLYTNVESVSGGGRGEGEGDKEEDKGEDEEKEEIVPNIRFFFFFFCQSSLTFLFSPFYVFSSIKLRHSVLC